MIENSLYLACCQSATAIAADHLVSHRLHTQSAIEKMEALATIPEHLAANIATLKTDFQREELLNAQGLDYVR